MTSNVGHYARAAGGGEGIPAPSPQQQEVMLDAWREALAQVLRRRDNDWQQQLRAIKAESLAAIAELRANAAEFRSTMEAMIEKRLAQIREPADGRLGEPGPRGEPGPPGKMERVYGYVEDAVHYRGEIVTYRGSTYQARCDTAREPPHEDWTCVASAGVDGKDGRDGPSLEVRGLFSDKEIYKALDIVALDGGSFIAKKDNPGPCPGAGWQLIASQGKRGERASADCRAFRASRSSSRSGGSTETTTSRCQSCRTVAKALCWSCARCLSSSIRRRDE
jgi:hypothetical protein